MGTMQVLDTILERLKRSPINVARSELEMFRMTLKNDLALLTVIERIILTEQQALGAKAMTIVRDMGGTEWANLAFADTPALRAALGYQICGVLLDSYQKPEDFEARVASLGIFYLSNQGLAVKQTSLLDRVRVFSEVFLDPLVTYLKSGLDAEERILFLLSRYKQRSEWFGLDLPEVAEHKDGDRQVERRLRKDVLKYIFDEGVDFSVESEIPPGGGQVDILPILPDRGQLPIEVKVFDGGASRTRQHISSGLAQIADYGRKFNRPSAYFVVLNVKENSILLIPGTTVGGATTRTAVHGVVIYSVVCNLKNSLPSSDAARLERIEVPLPA